MAKQSGLGDNFYVGAYNLSNDIASLESIRTGIATIESTGIDKSAVERLSGIKDGGFEFTSYLNDAAGRAFPILGALPIADVVCSYFRGATLGNPAASCIGKQINYDGTRTDSGEITFKVAVEGNGYGLEWGRMLTDGVRTDTAATNGTGIDTVGSLSFGAQAYLHVFGFTGTSVTVKIQDSPDNVSFSDVTSLAFAAATAIGTQRISISNTSTVRRYVRAITTGTFTSAQFAVNVVKNEEAGVAF